MALPGRGWEENPSQVTGRQHRQQCKHGAQREHGARHGPHVAPHGAGEALTARHSRSCRTQGATAPLGAAEAQPVPGVRVGSFLGALTQAQVSPAAWANSCHYLCCKTNLLSCFVPFHRQFPNVLLSCATQKGRVLVPRQGTAPTPSCSPAGQRGLSPNTGHCPPAGPAARPHWRLGTPGGCWPRLCRVTAASQSRSLPAAQPDTFQPLPLRDRGACSQVCLPFRLISTWGWERTSGTAQSLLQTVEENL